MPFLFFGGAGITDFNYQEVRDLERALDSAGLPHRVRYYDTGHSWPPPDVFREALEWMELQAIRSELRPLTRPLVESIHDRWMESARQAEQAGDLLLALQLYRGIVRDFEGLRTTVAAEVRLAELRKDRATRRAARRAERL